MTRNYREDFIEKNKKLSSGMNIDEIKRSSKKVDEREPASPREKFIRDSQRLADGECLKSIQKSRLDERMNKSGKMENEKHRIDFMTKSKFLADGGSLDEIERSYKKSAEKDDLTPRERFIRDSQRLTAGEKTEKLYCNNLHDRKVDGDDPKTILSKKMKLLSSGHRVSRIDLSDIEKMRLTNNRVLKAPGELNHDEYFI